MFLNQVMGLDLSVAQVAALDVRTEGWDRAWMIRAYAIGLAAGTQVFTEGLGSALAGTGQLRADLSKGAGWAINLAVAEWLIRRPAKPAPPRPRRLARPGAGVPS